ncbi:hypothetical protein Cgig2_016312 [Carnegiea gigantea]|uniref:Tim10-like domain-containing protein n=1 Tax=Carnegiea gigantea TaxID=171969 RepID=A0A9Q1QIJ9_9CARY|nr:hypothetical protein Cgig2_016312 [Carnegiea gigantea]
MVHVRNGTEWEGMERTRNECEGRECSGGKMELLISRCDWCKFQASSKNMNPKVIMSNTNSASGSEQAKEADSSVPDLDKEKIMNMATSEMEYRVELFNRLTHTCFDKCVEKRYKEGELHIGENSCIDRCVSKYWQVAPMTPNLVSFGLLLNLRQRTPDSSPSLQSEDEFQVNNMIGQVLGSGRPTT